MRRTLNASMQSGPYREEHLNGRDYIVVNMTLIVPGVLDGSNGPLLYEENELAKDPDLWNGIPLIAYHPEITNDDGEVRAVSARDPKVLQESQLGYNYRTQYVDNALRSEGWFDKELVANYDAKLPEQVRILPRLLNGQPIEISTGLFAENVPHKGTHNGTPYHYVTRNYKADHIAILPDQKGACSVNDGCGTSITTEEVHNCRFNYKGMCVNCGGKGGKPGPCPKGDKGGSKGSSKSSTKTPAKPAQKKAFRTPHEANKASDAAHKAATAANMRFPVRPDSSTYGAMGQVPHEEAVSHYVKKQKDAAQAHEKAEKEHRKLADIRGPTSSRHKSIADHHKSMAEHYKKRATTTHNKSMSKQVCMNCGGEHGRHGPCPKGHQGSVKGSDSDSGSGVDDKFKFDKMTHVRHESTIRVKASTSSQSKKAMAATGKAKDDFGHTSAAEAHEKAEQYHTTMGYHDVAASHKYYAKYHRSKIHANNKVHNMKEKLIKWLTVNCDCWKGKEKILEELEEENIKDLKSQAIAKRITNAAAAQFKGAFSTNAEGEGEVAGFDYATLAEFFSIEVDITKDPVGFIKALRGKLQEVMDALDHSEPAPEPEPAPTTMADPDNPTDNALDDVGPAKDPTQTSNRNRKMTAQEFKAMMPDEYKDAWNAFVNNSRQERIKLLNQITNGASPAEKKILQDAYKSMPLEQLKIVAKRMGIGTAQTNNRGGYLPEDNLPVFDGVGGYNPNTDNQFDEDDVFSVPVENFSRKERFAQKHPNHLTMDTEE